jgi:hypothetical protein
MYMEESGVFGDSVEIIILMTFIKLCWRLFWTWEQITQSSQAVNKGSVSQLFSGIVFSIVISGVMRAGRLYSLCMTRVICVHSWVYTRGVKIDLTPPPPLVHQHFF